MSLNCVEIKEIINNINISGIIKKIYQYKKYSLIINYFNGINDLYLLINISDGYNRICLIPNDAEIEKDQFRFSEILNANISGGKIINLYQYDYSRIIILDVLVYNEVKRLIFRLWGHGSNILLVNEKYEIIECLRRMPKRDEWPGEIFTLPESSNKNDFTVRDAFKNNINEAVFDYYDKIQKNEIFDKKKNGLIKILKNEVSELDKSINSINKYLLENKEDKYSYYGELVKSNIYRIKKGDDKIEVFDYDTNQNVVIPLLPNLSPVENAGRYFVKYKKMKNGKDIWKKELNSKNNRLDLIKYYISQINNVTDIKDLYKIEAMIKKGIKKNINKSNADNKQNFREFILDCGFIAYVSKSAKDADNMLKNIAKGNDYWFHIRDYAGSHVVVKHIKGKELTDRAKLEAALLAVFYSKGKNDHDADVYFTNVKYLQKPKKGQPGLVIPVNEKNIKIKWDDNIINSIFNRKNE